MEKQENNNSSQKLLSSKEVTDLIEQCSPPDKYILKTGSVNLSDSEIANEYNATLAASNSYNEKSKKYQTIISIAKAKLHGKEYSLQSENGNTNTDKGGNFVLNGQLINPKAPNENPMFGAWLGKFMPSFEDNIKKLIQKGEIERGHQMAYVVGPPGAGKTSSINGYKTSLKAYHADADAIKAKIAADLGLDINNPNMHDLSGWVMKNKIIPYLSASGVNFIQEKIGDEFDKMKDNAEGLKKQGYDCHITLVHVDNKVSRMRNIGRCKEWIKKGSESMRIIDEIEQSQDKSSGNTSLPEQIAERLLRKIKQEHPEWDNDQVDSYLEKMLPTARIIDDQKIQEDIQNRPLGVYLKLFQKCSDLFSTMTFSISDRERDEFGKAKPVVEISSLSKKQSSEFSNSEQFDNNFDLAKDMETEVDKFLTENANNLKYGVPVAILKEAIMIKLFAIFGNGAISTVGPYGHALHYNKEKMEARVQSILQECLMQKKDTKEIITSESKQSENPGMVKPVAKPVIKPQGIDNKNIGVQPGED